MPFRISGLFGMLFACIIYQILITGVAYKKQTTDNKKSISVESVITSGNEQKMKILSTEKKSLEKNPKNNNIHKKSEQQSSDTTKVQKVMQPNVKNSYSNTDNKSVKKIKCNTDKNENSKMKILYGCAFSLNLWLLMLVGGLTTFVLKSMADWTGLFLIEHCGLDISLSTELMLWNEMGGIIGTLLCGVLSDYVGGYCTLLIFVGICVPPMMYFPTNFGHMPDILTIVESTPTISLYLSLYDFGKKYFGSYIAGLPMNSVIRNVIYVYKTNIRLFVGPVGVAKFCLFFMGFGINGPKTLLGVMVRDLVPIEVSGTIGGIFGLIAQVGASVSGAGKLENIILLFSCSKSYLHTVVMIIDMTL